jgi:3-hydroxybutyrate dehydrogenase
MIDLTQKNVLVTGGTSGIGLAIAKRIAKCDANIINIGVESMNDVNSIVDELSSIGKGHVTYYQVDMSDLENLQNHVIFKNHKVDILINNAGMQYVSPLETYPMDKYLKIMNLNLHAPFIMTQKCLPHMRENGWGRIINIASVHGLVASANKSAYVSAKHGLVGLTKVTAIETGLEKITCNAICPGWVYTPLVDMQIKLRCDATGNDYEFEKNKMILEKQVSPEFTKPESIAEMCLFLCSEAGNEIRGAQFVMDGGWTIL